MREILLLNLTRMGDIVQKTPTVVGLKELYPGAKVSVLVNTSFAEICNGMPFIDRVFRLDKSELIKKIRDPNGSLVQKVREIEQCLAPVREIEYDLVLNLTHSRASAILLHLLRTKEIRGITMDSEGHRLIRHPWMNYFFCAVSNRAYNSFNLVDMYLKAAGINSRGRVLQLEVFSEDERFASNFLGERGIRATDVLIGLQPGASNQSRCWPVRNYAALADRLIREAGAKVIFFGGPGEKSLSETIIKEMKEAPLEAVAQTTPLQLAALLRRCRVLVSPDTGPMHIATAVGTRVVALFLNTAFYPETGPYGDGHLVLHSKISCYPCNFDVECRHRVCQEDIGVDHVFRAVRLILSFEPPYASMEPDGWEQVGVLQSHFDEDGLLNYSSVIRRPAERMDLLRTAYREMWKTFLDQTSREKRPLDEDVQGRFLRGEELVEAPAMMEAAPSLVGVLERAGSLAERGMIATQSLFIAATEHPPQADRIRSLGEELETVDEELVLLGSAHEELRPLVTLFQFGKENLEGESVADLSRQSHFLYKDLQGQSSMLMNRLKSLLTKGECCGRGI